MGVICFIISLIISYFGYSWFGKKKVYAPLFLFALFWGILCFLSELRLYRLYETSSFAYLNVLIGVLGFTLGCVLIKVRPKVSYSHYQTLSPFRFKVVLGICIIGLYLNFKVILSFLRGGFDISYIYYVMASDPLGEGNELSGLFSENLLRLQQFVGYPLLYTLVPIAIAEYIEGKKKFYLYIVIFLSLTRFLVDIRRTYIVIIVLFVIVLLVMRRNKFKKLKIIAQKISLKSKITIAAALMVITGLFSVLSQIRLSEDDENEHYTVFSNFYHYYVGSLPYFSQRLEQDKGDDYTYGFTSFRGLVSPFVAVAKIAGVNKVELMDKANENVTSLHGVTLPISPAKKSNSYATLFYEFYFDGGIFGVFLFSFLFGMYSQRLFLKAEVYKTKRYIWKYSYLVSLFLFLSVLHFNGVVVCYIWPFVLERFLYKRASAGILSHNL